MLWPQTVLLKGSSGILQDGFISAAETNAHNQENSSPAYALPA